MVMSRCSSVCLAILLSISLAEDCGQKDLTSLLQVTAPEVPNSDLSEIMEAAKGAIGKVTSTMTNAFEIVESNLVKVEKNFNLSLAHYEEKLSPNATLKQNLTAFQALMDQRVKDLEPFYADATEKVTRSFSTAQTAMRLMGQKWLLEKLDQVKTLVSQHMNELADTAKQMNLDMAGAREERLRDYIVTMIQKFETMDSVAVQLSSDVNDGLQEIGGRWLEALKLAVGLSAEVDIQHLSGQAKQTMQHLQNFLSWMKTNFERCSTGIHPIEYQQEQGFWGPLFPGLVTPA